MTGFRLGGEGFRSHAGRHNQGTYSISVDLLPNAASVQAQEGDIAGLCVSTSDPSVLDLDSSAAPLFSRATALFEMPRFPMLRSPIPGTGSCSSGISRMCSVLLAWTTHSTLEMQRCGLGHPRFPCQARRKSKGSQRSCRRRNPPRGFALVNVPALHPLRLSRL